MILAHSAGPLFSTAAFFMLAWSRWIGRPGNQPVFFNKLNNETGNDVFSPDHYAAGTLQSARRPEMIG